MIEPHLDSTAPWELPSLGGEIVHMNRHSVEHGAARHRIAPKLYSLKIESHGAVMRRDPEVVAVPQQNHSIIRRTQRDRRPHDGVENWLHNRRRAADDA